MKNNAELISALNVISKQRGISVDILADAIESALVSAYKELQCELQRPCESGS